ncbi:hypothetical protein SDC9_160680 [bioreactor metagenome]|jgi:uncharacterized DUF497 family protein|uniref:BrnT family toxin n=1 Tax=bioreactor metagenome TaxID=1076179 RepID=A0A645FJ33_9ZZZZ|nr:BrnT family toxin [Sphaerochaeta sp.]
MNEISFVWDDNKAAANFKKHGISFDEAKTVFYDPNAIVISDPDHSLLEDRFVILGLSNRLSLLVVCHCYRENDEVIRIISARKAKTKETQTYEGEV